MVRRLLPNPILGRLPQKAFLSPGGTTETLRTRRIRTFPPAMATRPIDARFPAYDTQSVESLDPRQSATILIRSRVRIVRLAALFSLLAILIPWYLFLWLDPVTHRAEFLMPILFAPLWSPLVWILFRLGQELNPFTYKRALALAISWGTSAALLAMIILSAMISSGRTLWGEILALSAFILLELSIVFAAIRAYYLMQRDTEDRKILLWRLGIALSVLMVCLAVPQLLVSKKIVAPEAAAIAYLRTINVAQTVYAQSYPEKGFAVSLRDLGPSPGAELIDAVLASGRKADYVITMYACPDRDGRVTRYTVVARPEYFGRHATRSFLTDETGLFHMTSENRPPTRQDPPL
jgi:hypothetical protein